MVGILTIVAVCAPLLLQPPAFQDMMKVLFLQRDFVHQTPSVWCVVKDFLGRWRTNDILMPYVLYIYVFFFIFAVVLSPFLFKKPSPRMFMAHYNLFAMTTYIFGFSVHEKHIQYVILVVLLYPQVYRGFLTYLQVISAMMFFPTSCMVGSEQVMWKYAAFFTVFSLIYEYMIVPADPVSEKYLTDNKGVFAGLTRFFRHQGPALLLGSVLSMICAMGMYMFTKKMDNYKCTFSSMFEDSSVKVVFGWLFIFYIYNWFVFFVTYNEGSEEEEAKKEEKSIEGRKQGRKKISNKY